MDVYTACSIVEGFDGEDHTKEDTLEAWQYLIDTGQCWHLQGWYGRTAHDLIEQGICQPAPVDHKDYYGNTVPGKPR
jgi:hypothetical protein